MAATPIRQEHQHLLDKYEHHFKHLRFIVGLHGLSGEGALEAVTPDGRYLLTFVSTSVSEEGLDELKSVLEDWSPKEQA